MEALRFDIPRKVQPQPNVAPKFVIAPPPAKKIYADACRRWGGYVLPAKNDDEDTSTSFSRYDPFLALTQELNEKRRYYDRVMGFSRLQDNWDGYGADPVNLHVLRNVKLLIASLSAKDLANWNLYPSVNGTVLLTIKGRRLSTIDIGANRFSYFASQLKGSSFCEGIEPFNLQSVVERIKQIESCFGLA